MTKAEQELINEINYYKKEIGKTQSKQRQYQLHRHIMKCKKELMLYRKLRYKEN